MAFRAKNNSPAIFWLSPPYCGLNYLVYVMSSRRLSLVLTRKTVTPSVISNHMMWWYFMCDSGGKISHIIRCSKKKSIGIFSEKPLFWGRVSLS